MNPAKSPEERFRAVLTRKDAEQLWGGVRALQRRRAQRRTLVKSVVLSALVAGVVATGVSLWRGETSGALTRDAKVLSVGSRLEVGSEPVRFDDGSRVGGLASTAELEIVGNEPGRFSAALRRGSVHVQVTPGGPRRWTLETHLATIEVVGTEFDVVQSEASVAVRVQAGSVMVQGERVPGRVRRLAAGDSLVLDAAPAPLARPPPPAPPRPEELLDRAGAAARAGRAAEAEALMQEAMARTEDPSARASVAMDLSRAYLETWSRPADALRLLEATEVEPAAPELLEGVAALKVRALADLGRLPEARTAARAHLQRYPLGPWAEEVRVWAR